MHIRWLFCFLFHALAVLWPLQAEFDRRSLENVPFLSAQRIETHTLVYRKKLVYLRWSKRAVIGGCGLLAGTYLVTKIASWLSSDQEPLNTALPLPLPPEATTPEDAEKIATQFKARQLKEWEDAEKRRAYKNSFKGLFMRAFQWTLITGFALTCAHSITQGAKPLFTKMKMTLRQWWYQDATGYYHDIYGKLTEQGRCMVRLFKLLQKESEEISSASKRERVLLHKKELFVFYSLFLHMIEKILALMDVMEKKELSFHAHHIVQGMHEASCAFQDYMQHADDDHQALGLFVSWFDMVMYALEGTARLMVIS